MQSQPTYWHAGSIPLGGDERELVLVRVRQITEHQAASYGCTLGIRHRVPGAVLVHDEAETARAAEIAKAAFGEDRVVYPGPTFLASEDFAFMLKEQKGT